LKILPALTESRDFPVVRYTPWLIRLGSEEALLSLAF